MNAQKENSFSGQYKNQTPVPPNDKQIHVSQCKNEMCPLKTIINGGDHSQTVMDQ